LQALESGHTSDWLKGIVTPVVTPFDDEENVDEEALRTVVNFLVRKNVHVLFALGGTSEFYKLSLDERKRVIDIVVDEAHGRKPVIAGCHANATKLSIELAKHSKDAGASGIVILQPYFSRLSDENLLRHYKDINDTVKIPLVIYSETGMVNEPSVEVMDKIADLSNTIGIKLSTYDMERFQRAIRTFGHKINVLAGVEDTMVPGLLAGAVGGVMMASNVAPEYWVKVYELYQHGKVHEAMKMQSEFLQTFFPLGFKYGFHEVLKEGLAIRGVNAGRARRPGSSTLSSAQHREVQKALSDLSLLAT
jgi:dihydrodipicolinate synthase/N-acetylneuraminate lyase